VEVVKRVIIYTDGACRGNPGPGGWGALLRWNGHERRLCGGERQTTNNRMEMTAAIHALEALKQGCEITLYTDSNYLRQGLTEWLPNWKRRGWRTAGRTPVKNQDLWQRLDLAVQRHTVDWHWVRGHSGNEGNELADALANEGLEAALVDDA
jgi:ribonuclease HI